jgi:hypothetical protein
MTNDSRYSVETRWSGSEADPSPNRLAQIVAELDARDEEHPDTWMIHTASGWSLRLDEECFAYLDDENLKAIGHMKGVSRAQGLDLWLRFATDGPNGVTGESWSDGPRVFSTEELTAIASRAESMTLESDREFFNNLGREDQSQPCGKTGCIRGRVRHSTLCKVHHFEQIRGGQCPFK